MNHKIGTKEDFIGAAIFHGSHQMDWVIAEHQPDEEQEEWTLLTKKQQVQPSATAAQVITGQQIPNCTSSLHLEELIQLASDLQQVHKMGRAAAKVIGSLCKLDNSSSMAQAMVPSPVPIMEIYPELGHGCDIENLENDQDAA